MDHNAVADVLDKAAVDLESGSGWCRGNNEDGAGRHCVRGAIYYVATGSAWSPRSMNPNTELAFNALDVLDARIPEGVVHFNDAQRDKRKVIRKLRRVADWLRGQ